MCSEDWVGVQHWPSFAPLAALSDQPTFERLCLGARPLVDVVFVHGLTGDPLDTWTSESGSDPWPVWLCHELDRVSVYTLGYPAGLFKKWAKREMDMFERAGNVLEVLAGRGLGGRPLVFVAHSLGGLLTKLVLRKSCEAADEDWRRVSESTKLVIFLGTPHNGSGLAKALHLLPGTSKQVEFLANEEGFLEDLNEHYRGFAHGRDDLGTVVYYEKHPTNSTVVVSKRSADPGVGGAQLVPVDKNHVNLCKPIDEEDVVYLGIKRRIQNVVGRTEHSEAGSSGLMESEGYREKSDRDRRDLLEKLSDAGREHEYGYANHAQNRFARRYTKVGLLAAAREDHDILLSEAETRFVTHVYHPLICKAATEETIREALQIRVIDPLADRHIGGTRLSAKVVWEALYFLTEQCYIRWDGPE